MERQQPRNGGINKPELHPSQFRPRIHKLSRAETKRLFPDYKYNELQAFNDQRTRDAVHFLSLALDAQTLDFSRPDVSRKLSSTPWTNVAEYLLARSDILAVPPGLITDVELRKRWESNYAQTVKQIISSLRERDLI
jgi:hypothetical protein